MDTELWASASLQLNPKLRYALVVAVRPTSTQHVRSAACLILSAWPQAKGPTIPGRWPPRVESNLWSPWGNYRRLASYTMTRVDVFEANAAHMLITAHTAEVSTPNGAALTSIPNNTSSHPRPLPFARLLSNHPNPQFTATLISHLSHGFDIGYQGHRGDVCMPNLPSALQHPEVIDKYVAQECAQGRIAGPFPYPPFHPFHCSGMGVIPKQDGTWRVITHLSAPHGLSVNDHIDPEAVTLSYTTIDSAIAMANKLGQGTLRAKACVLTMPS